MLISNACLRLSSSTAYAPYLCNISWIQANWCKVYHAHTKPMCPSPLIFKRLLEVVKVYVQKLLATEPSLLLVLGCGKVCHQTLLHVTQYHGFVMNSKHSCSDSHTHLLCFSLLWLAVCRGPCGFYLGHVTNSQCNVMLNCSCKISSS